MLRKREIRQIKRRKRYRDTIGAIYPSDHYFKNNHSLNCGCSLCKSKTFFRRHENKQRRLKERCELKNIILNEELYRKTA